MIRASEIISAFGLRNASLRGDELMCSCPFPVHGNGDSHPSFSINVKSGLAHCFSCGYGGNVVQMAEHLLGMNRIEAIHLVYPDLSIQEAIELMYGDVDASQNQIAGINAEVVEWANNRHPYWSQRGIEERTAREWLLGYDQSCNRVTIPVFWKGQLVGWTKRRVDERSEPKWLHSFDMPRNQILFGMDKAIGDSCILVEAPLSAIMLWQYGIGNAVASFGCNLSDSQAFLLRNHYNSICILYDPDKAGYDGTKRAISLLSPYMDVWCATGHRDDPAAMTKEECEAALANLTPAWAYDWR